MEQKLEANFSTLVLSIASSAAMSLGMAPDPTTGATNVDKEMAKFNIDLLEVLKTKSESNRSEEEDKLVNQLLNDLKMKYVAI